MSESRMSSIASILGGSRLFARLKPEQLGLIVSACEERMIVEGEDLFLEGDEGNALWIVLEGRVEIFKRIRGDVDRTLNVIGPGDVLGEISFVDNSKRSAGAKTLTSSNFLILSRDAFAKVHQETPEIAATFYQNLLGVLAARLRTTTELYRDSIEFGLDAVGAATLNLKTLSEELRSVSLKLSGGDSIHGRLLQVDHHAAGYALIIKTADEKLKLIPYHAIQWITPL